MTQRENLFEELSQINDDDFYQIWNSNMEEIVELQRYIQSSIDDYKKSMRHEISSYIENGIVEMKSAYLTFLMRYFESEIESEYDEIWG